MREDEDPKILVNSAQAVKKSADSRSDDNIAPHGSYDSVTVSQKKPAVRDNIADTFYNIEKAQSLYIKVPSRESQEFEIAKRLIDIFDGRTPVYFYIENDKKVLRAPSDLWVELNEVLLNELKNRLGDENIRLK